MINYKDAIGGAKKEIRDTLKKCRFSGVDTNYIIRSVIKNL